jgi:hypothetical protein
MGEAEIIELELEKIRLDEHTQPRAEISNEVIGNYAEMMREGAKFPPIEIFFDGCDYWLADGYHRYLACKSNESSTINANIRQGSKRDAILFSVGANATHGLPRNISDKRRAVLVMLHDEYWSQWSDNEIARRCGVNQSTVSRQRNSLMRRISEKSKAKACKRTYKTRHGTVSEMKTGNIGKTASSSKTPVNKFSTTAIRKARQSMPMTNLNMPHDPADGARAIMSAMGREYARSLAENINIFLNENQKEG